MVLICKYLKIKDHPVGERESNNGYNNTTCRKSTLQLTEIALDQLTNYLFCLLQIRK
jgi:hypothetical protein